MIFGRDEIKRRAIESDDKKVESDRKKRGNREWEEEINLKIGRFPEELKITLLIEDRLIANFEKHRVSKYRLRQVYILRCFLDLAITFVKSTNNAMKHVVSKQKIASFRFGSILSFDWNSPFFPTYFLFYVMSGNFQNCKFRSGFLLKFPSIPSTLAIVAQAFILFDWFDSFFRSN